MKPLHVTLCIVLFAWGCSKPESYTRTEVEVPVKVTEVSRKLIEEITVVTGTVLAKVDVSVKNEIDGEYYLQNNPATGRPYMAGDKIHKDDIIIILKNQEQENKIRLDSQQRALDNAKETLTIQQSFLEKGAVSQADVKKAEQAVIDAQYNYDNALMQLAKFKVKAPFSGEIVSIPYYAPGFKIGTNTEICRIMDYDILYLDVSLPGKLMGLVTEGMAVRVSSYLIPDKALNAVITQVTPVLDASTRTFKANIKVDNSSLIIKPGMFVKAEIVTKSRPNAIVIPKSIVQVRRNEKTVFIVSEGIAEQRTIKTGLENQDEFEVTEGLKDKEFLVTEGFETLRNGAKVTISSK